MTNNIYDITLPAQIGMQSFAQHVDRVRVALAKHGVGGYVEYPLAQRVFITPTGGRVQHAVNIFRVECATREAWQEIGVVLHAEFYGRAPYSIAGMRANLVHIEQDAQLDLGII